MKMEVYIPQEKKVTKKMPQQYRYLGDRHTLTKLRGEKCFAVLNNSKCIRGKNGNMLVEFPGIGKVVVLARLLRKIKNKLPKKHRQRDGH